LLCQFHPDKTPSLQIYPATNTYCCFSSNCNAGTGDQVQFIQLKENCSKNEALIKAASLLNANAITPAPAAAKLFIETEPLEKIAVLTKAFKSFTKALPMTKKAVEYMQSRALDYRLHEVGFITDRYHHETGRVMLDSCAKIELLKTKPAGGYNVWPKDCIIFPLKNQENKIISLYGRSISNDTDQRHFYLQNRNGLYPGYPALTTKKLLLTESIIDAASLLQQKEITEQFTILSLYGTNGLTDEHITAIVSLPQLEEIILMLNADEPGEAATAKHTVTLKQLLPAIKFSKVSLPAGEDINILLQSHEDAAILSDLIEQRTNFLFSIEKEKAHQAITTPAASKLNTANPELLIFRRHKDYRA
jgi:DNA primase